MRCRDRWRRCWPERAFPLAPFPFALPLCFEDRLRRVANSRRHFLTLEIGVGLRFFLGLILPALFGLDPRCALFLHLRLDPVDGVLVGANDPHRRFAVPEDVVVQR